MQTFQILRNAAPIKKFKANSIEEAKGILRKMPIFTKVDYFEIKSPEGKIIPVFSG